MKYPNILLIVMDSARSDLFGCYNKSNFTPNIDKIRSDSVICKNFYSAGSQSALSHTAIFTGQHSSRSGVVHNLSEIDKEITSLTQILKKNSYKNFGKCQNICPPVGYEDLFYFDELIYPRTTTEHKEKIPLKKNIIDNLRKYPKTWTFIKKIFSLTFGNKILLKQSAQHFNGENSLNYLFSKLIENKNNCFAYSTIFHPHTPYCPPDWVIKKLFGKYTFKESAYSIQSDFHAWINGDYENDGNLMHDLKKLYSAELYYGDYLIGNLIEKLKAEKIYDETLIIITSDHGEFFGEHNQINHGGTVYNEVIKVPLIIKFPHGYKSGETINKLTSHYDILPTITSYLGLEIKDIPIDGENIFDDNEHRHLIIDAPPLVLPGRLSHYPKVIEQQSFFWRSIINSDYKYVWKSDHSKFLYNRNDIENDENNIYKKNSGLANKMHIEMEQFYKNIDSNFDINTYPVNIGRTAAKFITSPRIIRELKKEGYL